MYPSIEKKKKTCKDIAKDCPQNSKCVDIQPTVCRCLNGFTMLNDVTSQCENKRVIIVKKLHIDTKWSNEFHDTQSETFVNFAIIMEKRLMHFFINVLEITGIIGVKVYAAQPGSVYVDFTLIYAQNISKSDVTTSMNNKLKKTNDIPLKEIQQMKLMLDDMPLIEAKEEMEEENNVMTLAVALSVSIVIISLVSITSASIMYYKKRRKI